MQIQLFHQARYSATQCGQRELRHRQRIFADPPGKIGQPFIKCLGDGALLRLQTLRQLCLANSAAFGELAKPARQFGLRQSKTINRGFQPAGSLVILIAAQKDHQHHTGHGGQEYYDDDQKGIHDAFDLQI